MKIDELLKVIVEMGGSDLHLKPMRPPLLRKDGKLRPLKFEVFTPEKIEKVIKPLLNERQQAELQENQSADVGYSVAGVSRFRVNVFVQRGTYGAVFRRIPIKIPSIRDWGLPDVLYEFGKLDQGLVLVTGPTGSGKSSTLAGMVREINETRLKHIITIEDPIEFLFRDERSAISQREVGMDTPSFQQALRNSLRQDPDIIMVGEMRDLPTIETAITASETGHLVLSTLHTNTAPQSIDRILDAFPANQQKQVRMQLAQVLQAVVSLKLVPRKDGKGRVAAVEICRNSPMICKLIEENRINEIAEEMEKSVAYYKMQSMNQSLVALVVNNVITYETALQASINPEDLDLMLRKIFFGEKYRQGGNMDGSVADYSIIEDLLEAKRHYDDLQEKYKFEIKTRDDRIAELQSGYNAAEDRLQQAFQQLDRLLKEKEVVAQEKDKMKELYERKISQIRKQYEEMLRGNQRRR
ncbi:MAG: type IV pili twitching motility protein PilT [Acidobacteria bacterium]|nr:MAG: type IV pili twitching motility protein PilT [Acidobacteriota bacterium]PIE89827.1 MAG: type IV pili twitching motility protein PilT [Acidobacteriota bacterium]